MPELPETISEGSGIDKNKNPAGFKTCRVYKTYIKMNCSSSLHFPALTGKFLVFSIYLVVGEVTARMDDNAVTECN